MEQYRVLANLNTALRQQDFHTAEEGEPAFRQSFYQHLGMIHPYLRCYWTYKYESLVLVGAIEADNLPIQQLYSIFRQFAAGVVAMQKHTGKLYSAGILPTKLGVFATFLPIFDNPQRAAEFNTQIKNFYDAHFLKKIYTSTISIDCRNETLTQGKGTLGQKWKGGIIVSALRNTLFPH